MVAEVLTDPCNILGPSPVGVFCDVATSNGADQVIGSALEGTTAGFFWTFLTDPGAALREMARDFFGAANGVIADRALDVDNVAVLALYGMTSAIGLMYAAINVPTTIAAGNGDIMRRLWALPGLLVYILSVGFGIPLMMFATRVTSLLAGAFGNVGSAGYEQLFETATTSLQGSFVDVMFPGASALTVVLMLAFYALVGVILYAWLVILNAVLLVLTIAYPIYAVGWIHPAPTPDKPSPRRQALYQYFDFVTAILVAPVVMAAILALAGGLLNAGEVAVASALLVISLFAPFALIAFLPIASLAGGAAGLGRVAAAPLASAARGGRRALAR